MSKPVVLCVLDGWGVRENGKDNAIALANTPCIDYLFKTYPHTVLQASEGYVGLPDGQMGNSEVGHTNLGAGRVVMQDLPRINQSIEQDQLRLNLVLQGLVEKLKESGGTCHLMGLLSPGGVHSHQVHLEYLTEALREEGIPVAVHAFLDGRDTPPASAKDYVKDFLKVSPIATLSGRFYAMDRDQRWDRIEKAYDAIVLGEGKSYQDPLVALQDSYDQGVTDEFMAPAVLETYKGMQDGDAFLMVNFRADRARQILSALVDPAFDGFSRKRQVQFSAMVGMVSYSEELDEFLKTIFEPFNLKNTLGEVIAKAGLKQLRIAETEKYAHVTFFFNGGREDMFEGEDRILVPSPKVATYDLRPEMSAEDVTNELIQAIEKGAYDFVVVNYANTDMVGHTGDQAAAMQAVEAVDKCLKRLSETILDKDGVLLITADHGNAEVMVNADTGQPHTAHTLNPVPLLFVSNRFQGKLRKGVLADVAPTILEIIGIEQPQEMAGQSLI